MARAAQAAGFDVKVFRDPRVPQPEWEAATRVDGFDAGLDRHVDAGRCGQKLTEYFRIFRSGIGWGYLLTDHRVLSDRQIIV